MKHVLVTAADANLGRGVGNMIGEFDYFPPDEAKSVDECHIGISGSKSSIRKT
jgi:hypothetical protein